MESGGNRLYAALMISSAGTLAVMGLALALLTIGAVIGPFRLFAPAPDFPSLGLGLWLAPSTQAAAAAERERRVDAWRSAVSGTAELVVDRSLSAFLDAGVRVVTLPDASALSEPEWLLLEGFLAGGGGVILTGSVGVQDAAGEPRGTALMEGLLRISHVSLAARGGVPTLIRGERGPLAAGLAPGQPLTLLPAPLLPGIDDPRADLAWLGNEGAGRAASRRLRVGAGRLVWLAAGPAEVAVARADTPGGDIRRVVAAAYAWAAREPFAEVLAATPGGAARKSDPAFDSGLRDRIAVRVGRTGPQRSLIEVSNRDATPIADLLLRVYLNTETVDVDVERTTLQQTQPHPSFNRAENRVDLRLPELAGGESQSYTLDIAPLATDAPPRNARN